MHGVVERVLAVVQTVGNALAEVSRNLLLYVARHVLADDVAAEGEGEAGFLLPPCSHVGDEMQTIVLVGQLALVDQQAGVDIAAENGLLDLVERNDDRKEIGLIEFEREVSARHHPRNGDALAGDFFASHRLARDEHRTITVAHRCAMGKQRVLI